MSLVDVAVTGHIGAPVYIGAIAVGGTMFNMLYWVFNFLRMGTSGLTATAYGAADKDREALVLWRSLVIALIIGVAMIVFSRPLCDVVLQFMDADDATAKLAARYFDICIWGAPAVMATYVMAGWFVGMQDSKAALVMAVAGNIVNIAVSLWLVFRLGWKIEGVATGTTAAQWAGALCGASIIYFRFRPRLMPLRKVFERRTLAAFFKLNSDLFLRTCCLVAVTVWFTHAGAVSGPDILAANTLLLQLFMLFSFFMDGFAYAGEALAGKYAGASDSVRLGSLVKALLQTGLLFAVIFALLYAFAGEWFMGILAEDRHVVEVAREYLPWAVVLPFCGFSAFIWDGIFVGTVASRGMLVSMAAAIAVFFILWFALHTLLGNSGLWLAFNAYLLTRGVVEHLIWRRRHPRSCSTSHSGS
ncbi:MAG: MATE family efflux transporter [Bacteroidales bacterium]|nr:MATE family efflux transporter [Bacteroidales bacterium]